jgi:hypothetical protein
MGDTLSSILSWACILAMMALQVQYHPSWGGDCPGRRLAAMQPCMVGAGRAFAVDVSVISGCTCLKHCSNHIASETGVPVHAKGGLPRFILCYVLFLGPCSVPACQEAV